MSKLPELQTAVRAVEGVLRASVRWPEPQGPATLHIEFASGEDGSAVARNVLGVLRQMGGVDLQSLRVEPARHAASAERPVSSAGSQRPVFSEVTVDRSGLESRVSVRMELAGRSATGSAVGLATERSATRSAAAATVAALNELLPPGVRVQLEWLEVVEAVMPERPVVVQTAVTCLSELGEETLVGSAIKRGGDLLETAAVRATLAALNRRCAHLSAA